MAKPIYTNQDFKGISKLIRPVLADETLENEAELGYDSDKQRPKFNDGETEKALLAEGDTVADLTGNLNPGLTITGGKLSLDLTSKPLVSPVISPTWTLLKNDGVTSYGANSTAKTITVDKGVKAALAATYQYPTPSGSQAAPAGVSGSFGTTLPAPATPSPVLNVSNIVTSQSFFVTLAKPKSGLIVSNGQVINATGNDTTGDNISITFAGRGVLAYFTQAILTAADIEGVLNAGAFQTSKARTFAGVTASGGKYTYYLLDAALGNPTSVIQNGALPVFSAFQFLAQVTITNAAGYSMAVMVMRSNATDAFSSASLAFS